MFSSLRDRIFNVLDWRGKRPASQHRGRSLADRFKRRLRLEALEDRRLLAALSVPLDLAGNANATVQVPVQIRVTETAGVELASGQFAFSFDANSFTVSNARVTGTLFEGFDPTSSIDNGAGTIVVSANGSPVHLAHDATGNLFLLDFQIKPTAGPGPHAINLRQSDATSGALTELNEGDIALDAPPTNASNDANVDGLLTVLNQVPSFTLTASNSVLEDSGAQAATGFATDIVAGPANESGQTVTFSVIGNTNSGLFSAQPSLSSSGTLSYTPAANLFGTATITVVAKDNGGTASGGVDASSAKTFTITVNSVNDAPSFNVTASDTVLEDSTARTVANFASGMSVGPANESTQAISSFSVTGNTSSGLFAVQPSISTSGTLTYTPLANAFGIATITVVAIDNGGTANGGVNTSAAKTFTINLTGINDAPSFNVGANQAVLDTAGVQTVPAWATGIVSGPANESTQTRTFTVIGNTNPGIFSGAFSVNSSSGTLTWSPAAGTQGTATLTLKLTDNGGTANAGVDTSALKTFTIRVDRLNHAPTFALSANSTVLEDAAAQSIASFASGISKGSGSYESTQTVTFSVTGNTNSCRLSRNDYALAG